MEEHLWEFPGCSVVRTLHTAEGPGSILGWGTKIPQALCRGPKKKKKEKEKKRKKKEHLLLVGQTNLNLFSTPTLTDLTSVESH